MTVWVNEIKKTFHAQLTQTICSMFQNKSYSETTSLASDINYLLLLDVASSLTTVASISLKILKIVSYEATDEQEKIFFNFV